MSDQNVAKTGGGVAVGLPALGVAAKAAADTLDERPCVLMGVFSWILSCVRGVGAAVVPSKEPCDRLDDETHAGEGFCACGVEWWQHEHRCKFDEVGAENERRRTENGEPPLPLADEPCDACGHVRSHRVHDPKAP